MSDYGGLGFVLEDVIKEHANIGTNVDISIALNKKTCNLPVMEAFGAFLLKKKIKKLK